MHGQLFADFSYLDPNNFKVNMPLPTTALSSIYDKIVHFIPEITYDTLRDEFTDFMSKWSEFKKTIFCENYDYTEYNSDNEYDGNDEEKCPHTAAGNKYCVVCIFNVLVKYNLYTNAYPSLYNCYKLLLTLSVTQVSCERSFSKLKYIKTYLRSTLSQDLLEILMLMSIEKELLVRIDSDEIIDEVACKSKLLTKLLLY